jgi:hypothetical protein
LRAGEDYTKDQEQRRYDRAHALKGFYVHSIAFAVVNLALFALNALVGGVW